ncbi:MAG: DUF1700 domain-containing protein [Lachnospiraceae bacterium]
MSKEEFLSQLEVQLSGMPENEKQEALQYYRDYFEDAGKEKEGEVLASLGSPEDVARNIREENGSGEYTERGYHTGSQMKDTCIVQNSGYQQNGGYQQNSGGQQNNGYQQNGGGQQNTGKSKDSSTTILVIVLIILLSPLWIPLISGLFGILIGLVATFVGFAVAGAAMVIGCVAALVGSVAGICMGFPVPLALMAMGAGLIVGALGVLFILLTVLVCYYVIPWIWKGIKKLWGMIFGQKEAVR